MTSLGRLRGVMAAIIAVVLVAAACGTPLVDAPATGTGTGADALWRTTPLRDVRTGEAFTIDELGGRLVAIEPMAIWCSSCRTQLREAMAALEATSSSDLVFIGVNVDPNEAPEALARYAQREGFPWPFVVASPDVARSLADTFGAQVLSPPSTPMILLGPDGELLDLHFGIRRTDELIALFLEHLP
jgi:thiol-disulfide isomerase/thioredoxin